MDFARINPKRDAERGATLTLRDPYEPDRSKAKVLTYEGKPICIELYGLESTKGRRAAAALAKARAGIKDDADLSDMDVDEIIARADMTAQETTRFYAALTKGWSVMPYLDDEKADDFDAEPRLLTFSEDTAAMLYETRPWIVDQVVAFLGDKRNFAQMPSSLSGSPRGSGASGTRSSNTKTATASGDATS